VLASQATGVASLFYGFVIVIAVLVMPKGLLDLVQGFRETGWRYFVDNLRRYRI
jgi:branched-chain amino acid transport system permease protein